jgi:hypothetical protein
MSLMMQNKWFRRVGFAAIAATVLGAATIPTAPAQARTWLSVAGIHFPIGGHVHHDYWRNGGWYHDNNVGWRRVW